MMPALTPAAALLILVAVFQPEPMTGDALLSGIDRDGDAVDDRRDACPETPRGYPVTPAGCALDTDEDGVADGADRCPETRPVRGGIDETLDENGCSLRDHKRERTFRYSVGAG